ncbi:MAG: hypothetical protein B7Z80_26995 [Rhodospirillales bacterium 20-64-7]|nr:MAG: hypothetical protein B7Z80_26995 [Rhodospirillales bacterium 20-64-7]HQT75849.1 glycosyltransferase family A protein [Rhodopila sp.]
MKISVVVPTYNRADLLPVTLDAILAQTLPPHEVIVIDDGSCDETPSVLRHYASAVRGRTIENAGELVARNTGLRMATGDLVSFCDSDDLWRPDLLASMAELWRRAPGVRTAYCDFVIVREDIRGDQNKFAGAPEGFWDDLRVVGPELGVFDSAVIDRLIRYQPFFPSCMTVDREFFLSLGGWDEAASRIVGCDFATTLRVGEHPPIGVVRKPLVGIRKHAGNFSADVQKMNLGDARILELVLASRPSLAEHRKVIEESIAIRRRDALNAAFARHDFESVKSIYPLLPLASRSPALRIKHHVANWPAIGRGIAAATLLLAGSVSGHLHTR